MFGFKKGKKLELDEYGMDSSLDLDFPDFGDGPKIPDDRKTVAVKTVAAVGKGALSTAVSPAFITQMVKRSLPKGYGQTLDLIDTGASSIRNVYNDASKEIKPAIVDLKRITEKIMPSVESVLPRTVAEKIKKWSKAKEGYADLSKEEQQNAALQMQLGEIFQMQSQAALDTANETKAKDTIKEAIDHSRHQDMFGQMDAMRISLQQLAGYQSKIESNYQRKSLELQFRSYFLAQEQLEELKRYHVQSISNFEGILKNTGLPEFVKLQTSERLKEVMRNKFIDRASETLIGARGQFVSKVLGNVGGAIKNKVSDVMGNVRSGLDMADQVGQIGEYGSMMGMSSTEVVGNMLGSLPAEALGEFVSKNIKGVFRDPKTGEFKDEKTGETLDKDGLAKKLTKAQRAGFWIKNKTRDVVGQDRLDKIEKTGNKLSYITENAPQHLTGWANKRSEWGDNEQDDSALGKLKSLFSTSGALSGIGDVFEEAIRSTNSQDNLLETDKAGSLNAPAAGGFTNFASKSITEIIPGYLSQILRELHIVNAGEDKDKLRKSIDLIDYDITTNKFDTYTNIKKSILDTLTGNKVRNVDEQQAEIDDLYKRSGLSKKDYDETEDKLKSKTLTDRERKELEKTNKLSSEDKRKLSYLKDTLGKNVNDYSAQEVDNFVAKIDEDNELTPKQRKILGELYAKENAKNQAFDLKRLSNQDTYRGMANEDKEAFAKVHEKFASKDTLGYKLKNAYAEYNRLGERDVDPREPAQNFVNLGKSKYLKDLNFLNDDSGVLNIDAIRNARLGGEEVSRAHGGIVPGHRMPIHDQGIDTVDAKLQPGEFVVKKNAVDAIGVDKLHAINNSGDDTQHFAKGGKVNTAGKTSISLLTTISETLLRIEKKVNEGLTVGGGSKSSKDHWWDRSAKNLAGGAYDVGKAGVMKAKGFIASGLHSGINAAKVAMFGTGKNKQIDVELTKTTIDALNKLPSDEQLKITNDLYGNKVTAEELNIKYDIGYKSGKKTGSSNIIDALKSGGIFGGISHLIGKGVEGYKGFRDVYIKGEAIPRLKAWKLQAGEYYDVTSKKVIKSYKDISGAVMDKDGNIILTAEEVKNAIVKAGIGEKLITSLGSVVKFGKGVVNDVLGAIPPILKFGMNMAKKAYNLTNVPQDVYVKGKPEKPVLLAMLFKIPEAYISTVTGKWIKHHTEIDGPVYGPITNGKRNTALTMEDLQDGLVDWQGKPLRTGLMRIAGYFKDKIMAGVNKVKQGATYLKDKIKDGFNFIKDKAKGGVNIPKVNLGGIYSGGGGFSGNSNLMLKRLTQIRDLINAGLPGNKRQTFNDADDLKDYVNVGKKVKEAAGKLYDNAKSKIQDVLELNILKKTKDVSKDLFNKVKDSKLVVGTKGKVSTGLGFIKSKLGLDKKVDPNEPLTKTTIEAMMKLPSSEFEDIAHLTNNELNIKFDPEHTLKGKVVSNVKKGFTKAKTKIAGIGTKLKNAIGLKSSDPMDEEAVIAAKETENTGLLKQIAGYLKPKEIRKGSYEDEEAAIEKKKSLADKVKEGGSNAINKGKGLLGGIGSGIAGMFGKKKEEKEEGNDGVVEAAEGSAANSLAGKAWNGTKKLGGKLLKGAGWLGKGALGLLGMGGTGAATTAAAAEGATLAGGAATAGSGILAGIGAFLASPVVLGALAVAAVAGVGYLGYKYLTRKKLTDWNKIRYAQYGFLPTDEDHFKPCFELEDILKDAVSYKKGIAELEESKIKSKDVCKIFDVDMENKDQFIALMKWITNRFKPVYLTHLTALNSVKDGSVDLDDVEGLKPEEKQKYLDIAKYPDGPYNYTQSPFPKDNGLAAGKSDVDAAIAVVQTTLDKELKDKPLTPTGAATGLIAANAADRAADLKSTKEDNVKPTEVKKESIWDKTKSFFGSKAGIATAAGLAGVLGLSSAIFGIGATASGIGALAVGSVTGTVGIIGGVLSGLAGLISLPFVAPVAIAGLLGTGAYLGYKNLTKKKLDTISKVRYAQYGFIDTDVDHLQAVFGLEDVLKDSVTYSNGQAQVEMGKDKTKIKDAVAAFKVDYENKAELAKWSEWFVKRFKPVFLVHLSALNISTKNKTLDDVDKLEIDEKKKYFDIAKWPTGPYNEMVSPFPKDKQLVATKEIVSSYVTVAEQEIKDLASGKKLPTPSILSQASKVAKDVAASTAVGAKTAADNLGLTKTGTAIGGAVFDATQTKTGQKVITAVKEGAKGVVEGAEEGAKTGLIAGGVGGAVIGAAAGGLAGGVKGTLGIKSPAEHKKIVLKAMDDASIKDPKERAAFMATVTHETGDFKSIKEGNYKPDTVWRLRGKTLTKLGVTKEELDAAYKKDGYGAMFNYMYGDKYRTKSSQMGNESDADGELYKGRGYVQLTGKNNYARMGSELGLDLVKNPEMLEYPDVAAEATIKYWKDNKIGQKLATGGMPAVNQAINGGPLGKTVGEEDRNKRYERFLKDPEVTNLANSKSSIPISDQTPTNITTPNISNSSTTTKTDNDYVSGGTNDPSAVAKKKSADVHAANWKKEDHSAIKDLAATSPVNSNFAKGGLVEDNSGISSFMSPRAMSIMAQRDHQKNTTNESMNKVHGTLESSLKIHSSQLDVLTKILGVLSSNTIKDAKTKTPGTGGNVNPPNIADNVAQSKPTEMPRAPVSMSKSSFS